MNKKIKKEKNKKEEVPWVFFNVPRGNIFMSTNLRNSYGVDKKLSYISETFNGERKKGYGILSVGYAEKTVTFESFKGPDPDIQDLLFFLFSDKDVRKIIREYQKKGRKEDYKIDIWSSSATKVYINFYRRGIFTYRKPLFTFTCNQKTNKIDRIYIGDLVEAVVHFDRQQDSCWFPYIERFDRKWLRSRTTFKYEKCEYEPYVKTGATRII